MTTPVTAWPTDRIESLRHVTEQMIQQGDLVRQVIVRPEFDCWNGCHFAAETCRPHTGGWHGIGARRILFVVAVLGRGAVSLELSTPIYTDEAHQRSTRPLADGWEPIGALDFHYAGDPGHALGGPKPCPFIDGECWGDITYLGADPGFDAYRDGGTPAVWAWLGEAHLPEVLQR